MQRLLPGEGIFPVTANSRSVETNQLGPHAQLEKTVRRHLAHPFLKPIADHTRQAFLLAQDRIASTNARPIILDSCCGTGDSSRTLAAQNPSRWVVGVDKSASRLNRERQDEPLENLIFLRADLNDFYRLASAAGWQLERHYILYPNPWPKSVHMGRRWHGSSVFPDIVKLGGVLELRSNWKLYLEEFQIALEIAGHKGGLKSFEPESFLTLFEKKFHESGQPLWRMVAKLS
ncbi:MAG: SAM-dependent methyltransferase [Kordiimonadales bacterium]|nr:MAG: SAM-dependent methyltransferase [Kordiimonadales bacterium]